MPALAQNRLQPTNAFLTFLMAVRFPDDMHTQDDSLTCDATTEHAYEAHGLHCVNFMSWLAFHQTDS